MKRLNAAGALAALIVGFAMGMFRLAVDTPVSARHGRLSRTATPAGSFLWIVNNIYFQYYSVLIFLVSALTMIGVSYATAAPSDDADPGPDVRDRDPRAEGRDAPQLEPLGRDQLGDRPDA